MTEEWPSYFTGRREHIDALGVISLSYSAPYQIGHGLILDRTGPAGTHLIIEPLDPIGDEAFAPRRAHSNPQDA
jgi:hypothetical protein